MTKTHAIRAWLAALAGAFAVTAAYAGPVNINTANAETLAAELNGIGLSKARAIVAYRTRNGAFSSIDELTAVKGIGARTVEQNRSLLLLSDGGAEPDAVATEETNPEG